MFTNIYWYEKILKEVYYILLKFIIAYIKILKNNTNNVLPFSGCQYLICRKWKSPSLASRISCADQPSNIGYKNEHYPWCSKRVRIRCQNMHSNFIYKKMLLHYLKTKYLCRLAYLHEEVKPKILSMAA